MARHLGFTRVLTSVGQVYPRSLDLDVVSALSQAVAGPASLVGLQIARENDWKAPGVSASSTTGSAEAEQ